MTPANRVVCLVLFLVEVAAVPTSGCPTWFIETDEECKCGEIVLNLICNEENGTVEAINRHCVTFDNNSETVLIGLCPYSYHTKMTKRYYHVVPNDTAKLNNALCGPYNREGVMCAKCIKGFGPAVYSANFQCANCSHLSTGYAVSLYLILTYVPIAILFLIVIFFHFNITSGPMLGYVIYCQGYILTILGSGTYASVVSYVPLSLRILFRLSVVLSDVWTPLPFRTLVPPFCLSDSLTNICVHMLGLGIPLFLVLLMIIAYTSIEIHAKSKKMQYFCLPVTFCFTKFSNSWDVGNSLIHAFATFIILSSYTIMYNIYNLVKFSPLYNVNATSQRYILFIDSNIAVHSTEYIVCVAFSVVVCIPLAICPALLLCLYPTRLYEKLSRCISARKRIAIKIFVEALHSSFKDGLNGTQDYRILAGFFSNFLLVVGAAHFIVNWLETKYLINKSLTEALMFILISFCLSHMKPCKSLITNLSLSFHFLIAGIFCITWELWSHDFSFNTEALAAVIVVLTSLPHILILTWAGYKVACMVIPLLKIVRTTLSRAALRCYRKNEYQELSNSLLT